MKELAQRLIAFEEGSDPDSNPGTNATIRVIGKLRLILIRFSGSDSYAALMRRAIALARIEDPALEGHTLSKDGSLPAFEGLSSTSSLTLTAHLLDLMIMFIGQALTLTLLSDVWPIDELKDS